MKHFITTVVICVSLFGFSQQIQPNLKTITVNGSADIISSTVLYKTEVTLSLDNNYYTDNPCTTIDELKAKYFAELKKQGIDTSKFKENQLAYFASGYRKDGTILTYITSDKDEILKVSKLKMGQINAAYVQTKSEVDDNQTAKIIKQAVEDARNNAQLIANASGKKLGEIQSISSYDISADTYWQSLNYKHPKLRLTVVFALQ